MGCTGLRMLMQSKLGPKMVICRVLYLLDDYKYMVLMLQKLHSMSIFGKLCVRNWFQRRTFIFKI